MTTPGEVPQEGPEEVVPELAPMFPGAAPFLARFLPHSPPTHTGLSVPFCDLHALLRHFHDQGWYGYLHAQLGDQHAAVLLYEGRAVTAASVSGTGEQALGDLLGLYEQGAVLSAHPLTPPLAHALSGVGSRAWKVDVTGDFTGLHVCASGATFYAGGGAVATLPVTLPYEGAFPAPLRPQTLMLPRSLAGWAHHSYTLTLRGRDALHPITDVHRTFRLGHGPLGLGFLRALREGLTPAEHALRGDLTLHDLEPLLRDFVAEGLVRGE
ncbi:hypothetical protein [Deinococcus terrestris]|nr:hypothetical protein [Deinococcus terrestris]